MRLFIVLTVYALLFWLAIAHTVYAFRNPDMTDTRRLLNTKDALLFKP